MRNILIILAILFGCTRALEGESETEKQPDAGVRELPAKTCATATWLDAYATWVNIQCTATARCYPDEFTRVYGSDPVVAHASCVAAANYRHCISGAEAWCASAYPVERCDALARCGEEVMAASCDVDEAPASCYEALK